MTSFIDPNAKVEINCPSCRSKFMAAMRDIQRGSITCPKCSSVFDTTDVAKSLKDVERDLRKSFGG